MWHVCCEIRSLVHVIKDIDQLLQNAEILQLQEDREKSPADKRYSKKKSEEGVLSDGYLSDTGMDNSQSSTKKKKRPWRVCFIMRLLCNKAHFSI